MEVTDEMVDKALASFITNQCTEGKHVHPLRAALEAVFNHIEDKLEKVDKQAIKDFVDMIEWNDFGDEGAIIDTPEYQALKASISPVSEDKCKTHVKQCPGCKVNLYQDVCECPLEQPTDTQDNYGWWITHNGHETPDWKFIKFVDIKFLGGRELLHVSPLNYQWENWLVPSEKGHEHIIAYRIIEESKEEKEKCHCNGDCPVCAKFWENISSAEFDRLMDECEEKPKKQTLLEDVMRSPLKLTFRENAIIAIISEYMEKHLTLK